MADSNTPDNTRSGQTFFDSLSGIVNQEDITAILKVSRWGINRVFYLQTCTHVIKLSMCLSVKQCMEDGAYHV